MDYGIAWEIDEAGNVVFNRDGTLQTVEELENLGQSIRILLYTIRGEDQWNKKDGVAWYEFLGHNFGSLTNEVLELFIRDALISETEPKIKEVKEVVITRNSDRTYTIAATVVGQNEETTRIITEIGE